MTTAAPSDVRPQPTEPVRGIMPVFLGLMLTMLMASLNQTILSTALPTMVGELHGVDEMLWVISAYILASTITMPIYGKIGDLVGRKSLLIVAIVLFVLGSIVGGLAGDMTWLIVGRAIQGLGGGGLMILSQAIIADVVPARDRGKYMGLLGAAFAVSSVAGPLLGGWFTEGPGWRWAFWINIPLGIMSIAGSLLTLHLPKPPGPRPRMDYLGMALLAAGTTSLVLVGTWGGSRYDWDSPVILGLIGVTGLAAGLFALVEARVDEPIMPLHLFRDRNFNLTTASGLLTGVVMFGAIGYMPTYLQMTTEVSATEAGLLMVPMMGSLLITSVLSGVLVSRTGRYKWLPIAGSTAIAGAMVLLSTMTTAMPLWEICGHLALLGVGLGVSMQLLVLIVQNSFPARQVGTATAAHNYFRQIGATLGSAVVGSLFATRLVSELARRLPQGLGTADGEKSLTPEIVNSLPDALRSSVVESYNDALTPIFLSIAPLSVVATILLLFIHEKPLATTIEREIPAESLAEGQLLISLDDEPGSEDGRAR